ncbi:MAG TPA: hypothetical protein VGW80_04965 [Solirubrobacterales bacterium]|jgi:hypothetical protein|nr:hypothetical protein [Solirubrobacterales bacterium]
MAKKRIVFDFDQHRTKIRYKRAYLTVEQTVRVIVTPVEEALAGHRTGAVTEEEVAEAFLREQVTSHTPSFDWEKAELDMLLERVAAVVNDPELKARTPYELVPELEAVEVKEREKWAELSKGMTLQISPFAKELQEKLRHSYAPMFTKEMREKLREHTQTISGSLTGNPALAKATEAVMVKFHGGLSAAPNSLLPKVELFDAGLDPSVFDDLRQGILDAQFASPLITTNFDQWIVQAVSAAQEVKPEEIVGVGGADVEQRDAQISDADLKELIERLSEIAKSLQEQAGSNQMAMVIVAGVISGLILYVIQYVLAVKYGIALTPPEKTAP